MTQGNAARTRSRAGVAALLAFAAALSCEVSAAVAKPLDQLIPGLFGGAFLTTIDQSLADRSSQPPQIAGRFRNLSAALSAARSQLPNPSASGAFSFAWDSELDTFVRFEQSLGSMYAERAQTLGRHRLTVGLSYTHIDFDTIEGDPLDDLRTTQPALSAAYLATLPEEDRLIFGDDILTTRLSLSFTYDLFFLTAAYGFTDDIDVSMALTVNRARMKGSALAMTSSPDGRSQVARFTADQVGAIIDGSGPVCSLPFRCAADGFDETAVGTGDIYLRGKWHFADTHFADLAVAAIVTLPTGNADDFLGFHDPTFTPWLIASKSFGRFSPHANLGYSFRSGEDVSQLQWIAGGDLIATRWLTLGADFLGYHDDKRDGINDDVVQSAVGLKLNPFGGLVVGTSFQFPVNRDGLRADVIYTGQVEYTF